MFTSQMITDHAFMNKVRECKGGEKLAILRFNGNIYLDVTVVPQEKCQYGTSLDWIVIDEYAELTKETK